ncbi:uncharacterized protein [Amphiura filiformis]|uniref:uncharacterized protein n=1 Tax=Amphiura filiformis TaxID=82378 RepID=UPI003B216AC4
MKDDTGYQEAKKLLQKRFGNVHRTAEAYLSKVRAWPNITNEDSSGLQEMSLFLMECIDTMESLGYTSELHSTANIRLLVGKLPYKMKDRWRQRVDYIEEDVGRPVRFEDFSLFVEKQARIQNNAAFGKISDREGNNNYKGANSRPKVKRNFATSTDESFAANTAADQKADKKSCNYCEKENHNLDNCFKLMKLPAEQKLKYLKEQVLHLERLDTASKKQDTAPKDKEEKVTNAGVCHCHHTGAGDNSSPCIIPVKIRSSSTGITVETYAYLDSGSDATFCTKNLSQQLNLKGRSTTLDIQTMTGSRKVDSRILQGLEIYDMDTKNSVMLPKVYTKEEIPARMDHVVTQEQISSWPYLEKVCLTRLEDEANAHIGLLIGNNVPQVFKPWEVIHSSNDGPYACRTLLGWTVYGMNNKSSSPLTITRTRVEETPTTSWSLPDRITLKDHNKKFPNNRQQAEVRAAHLKKRFSKNPEFHADYKSVVNDMINKEYAQKVPEEEEIGESGRTWYIPHHGVYHPRKNKLRVVYDCAVNYMGHSLNKELLQGTDLTSSLVGVMLRFRQECIAVTADIENDMLRSVKSEEKAVDLVSDLKKACKDGGFNLTKWTSNSRTVLQSIPEEDRSKDMALVDLDTENLPTERVLGMLWSPEADKFGYQITVKDRPPTRRGILSVVSSVYDPLGFISPAILPAKQLMQELCKLKIGWDEEIPGAHLRMWQQWIAELPKLEHLTVDRCYKPPHFGKVKSTQLHHFSDASLKGYGTVSYLRSENEDGDIHCALVIAKARVAPVKQVTVPRLELNASTVAVRVNTMIQHELDIPINKTVFWTDSMTVLRYINNEAARFKTFVANRLGVIHDGSHASQWRYVPTKDNPADDSSRGLSIDQLLTTDRWLKGPKFLWSGEEEWPACQDIGQGVQEDDMEVKKVNVMMVQDGKETKSQKEETVVNVKDDDEVKGKKVKDRVEDEMNGVEMLMKHFSSWYRLKKAIAWILKVKKQLIQRSRERKKAHLSTKDSNASQPSDKDQEQKTQKGCIQPLTVSDMQDAEKAAIGIAQRKAFPQEIAILKSKTSSPGSRRGKDGVKLKKISSISKLNPFVKDGLLRVGGRLARAAMPEDEKFPVILPKESCITDLVMREIHEVTGHGGRNHMLSRLQRRFWIKTESKGREQQMADLPRSRVNPEEAPFTRVGVDYFGPVEVKRGRSVVKRYGMVFTCLAVRAIHIEKADTLETDSCICAIRRFIARRGQVKEVWSDNGTNLVGAKRELQEQIRKWNQAQIHSELLQDHVDWRFNPPWGLTLEVFGRG